MAKQQELIELFPKYDTDSDGQIYQAQFSELMTELGVPTIYPGSIKKMFRKLNYNNPEKLTINLQQAKEYYNSLETPSKHDIWKAKYKLLELASQVRKQNHKEVIDSAAPAAPGVETQKQAPQDTPQQARVSILIGENKPNYLSEIEIEIQKNGKGPKVKPFIKLTLTSSTVQRAKTIQTVFKQNFHTFLNLLGQDIHDWMEQMKNFHINSMVQGTTTTFFITTVNEEMVSLIQLFSELFELSFSSQLEGRVHVKYQFEYNFEDFIKNQGSNFYDIFIRNSRFTFNGRALQLFKQLRRFFKNTPDMFSDDIIERVIPLALLHLDQLDGQFQFDSFDQNQQYQLQSKQQIVVTLREIAGFLQKLVQGGMNIESLLDLLDGNISLEASVGEWRCKTYFRLLNFNKIFLEAVQKKKQQSTQTFVQAKQPTGQGLLSGESAFPVPENQVSYITDSYGNIIIQSSAPQAIIQMPKQSSVQKIKYSPKKSVQRKKSFQMKSSVQKVKYSPKKSVQRKKSIQMKSSVQKVKKSPKNPIKMPRKPSVERKKSLQRSLSRSLSRKKPNNKKEE